ncbi:MAG: glycosyltransferase [Anaerolineae bacterium]
MNHDPSCIGFVSTRFAGTDGVSLETEKWATILEDMGHRCCYFAGECDRPVEQCYVVPEAHFSHPRIQALNADLFNDYVRQPETSQAVDAIKAEIKEHLYRFLAGFSPDLLIVENAFAIPMNVPLGLALMEVIAETHLPAIGHHHDFAWERQRFSVSAAQDYLQAAFPPTLPSVRHVTINSAGERQLALRHGVSSTLIPNVMDFETSPPAPDGYADDLRAELGISPDAYLILQPTRIVPRKRIERAIELVRRLELPAVLLISHTGGDEGAEYEGYLRDYAAFMGATVIFAGERINHKRGRTPEGKKIYSLADVYQQADLVTYPSAIEGFGNAFLEAIYYRRPIVVQRYAVFQTDILTKGFRVLHFADYLDAATVQAVRDLLRNPQAVSAMVDYNYALGKRYYAYATLKRRLSALLDDALGG